MNLLFVCSRNQWRSPTAERVFCHYDNVHTRSAGTASSARHRVNTKDISWADIIFVMEYHHKDYLTAHFTKLIKQQNTKIVVLDIPDNYQYMSEELVTWLEEAVSVYL